MLKVSFVIPAYNSAAWLPMAVESCRKQSYLNIEIVIVDDASTDSTPQYLDWLKKQNDTRINIITNVSNQGRSASRNSGNLFATGDVICVLDADDIAMVKRAEITAKQFENGAKFLYGSAIAVNALEENQGEIIADVFQRERAQKEMVNSIVHSTVAYTKQVAKDFPYMDGDISRLGIDDWAQQTAIYLGGIRLDFVPNVLSKYRMLETGIQQTRSKEDVEKAKKAYLESMGVMA